MVTAAEYESSELAILGGCEVNVRAYSHQSQVHGPGFLGCEDILDKDKQEVGHDVKTLHRVCRNPENECF
jgi:hypothetical protein